MDREDVAVWCGLVALGIAFEFRELREGPNGVPLSRLIRATFRTHHPAGAAVFRTAVALGSVVLVRHICPPDRKAAPCTIVTETTPGDAR